MISTIENMLCIKYYLRNFNICLLMGNYVFYCIVGIKTVGVILIVTVTIWGGVFYISKIEDKKKICIEELKKIENPSITKKEAKDKQIKVFWIILILNSGILALLK